jgi:SAM-dependent methyltransferase
MPGKRERDLVAASAYMRLKYSERRAPRTGYPDRLVRHLTATTFGQPGKLVDLGCGRGDQLEAFRRAGYDCVGVDIHDDRHPSAKRVDLEEPLPFETASLDAVFTKSVIEHLSDPLFVLTEAHRVLRPGGRIVVLTPSWRHTGGAIFYSEYTHVRPFTLQSLAEALHLAGFHDVSATYFWQLPAVWRHPSLRVATLLPRVFRVPYRPLDDVALPTWVNRWVRFSREVMVLGTGAA